MRAPGGSDPRLGPLLALVGGLCAAGAGVAAFPHETHVRELSLSCTDCHDAVARSRAAADRLPPRAEVCRTCHEDDAALRPWLPPGADGRVRVKRSARGLAFAHALHLDPDGPALACQDCHTLVARPEPGAPAGVRIPAREKCGPCHEPDPYRRGRLGLVDLATRPHSHDAFWRDKHGLSTRSERETCASCHATSFCQDCHQGDVETRYHRRPFRYSHGLEARLTGGRCQTCHLVNFCGNCHGRVGR